LIETNPFGRKHCLFRISSNSISTATFSCIIQCSFCLKLSIADLRYIGILGDGAASWGVLYEHKKLVELAEESDKKEQEALKAAEHDEATCTDPTHDHSHSSSNHAAADHDEATCTDPTHDHSHSSSNHAVADHDEATCTDPTHDHSHSASSHADHDEATCTDPTHDHSHSSSSHADHDEATCTDPTHDHSHSKTSHSQTTTAEERFGINSFVYKRRTPFHPGRFSLFLQGLGKLSVKGISEIASTEEKRVSVGEAEGLVVAKKALLRSKGFVWMGTSKTAAYFISHAGQYLELMVLGRWWADIPQADWPKGSEDEITVDFDGHNGESNFF
jgi:G3E family GTPase